MWLFSAGGVSDTGGHSIDATGEWSPDAKTLVLKNEIAEGTKNNAMTAMSEFNANTFSFRVIDVDTIEFHVEAIDKDGKLAMTVEANGLGKSNRSGTSCDRRSNDATRRSDGQGITKPRQRSRQSSQPDSGKRWRQEQNLKVGSTSGPTWQARGPHPNLLPEGEGTKRPHPSLLLEGQRERTRRGEIRADCLV